MNESHDLELLFSSHFPIIVVESLEEARVLQLLSTIGLKRFKAVNRWSVTGGLSRLDIDIPADSERLEPEDLLWQLRREKQSGIYVLCDFHPYINNPLHIRLLKDVALAHQQSGVTLVLLSYKVEVPPELKPFSVTAEISLPDREALERIVMDVTREWRQRSNKPVRSDEANFKLLVQNLAGLTREDAVRIARNAIFDDGAITESDLPQVMKAKHALLSGEGVLSFEFDTARFGEVGGLRKMKAWLEQRRSVFLGEHDDQRLDPPKGVLLLGVQGGGKSLAAKAVAGSWHVPLLRLDFAAIHDKYHGESERKLRESLKMAETMSPCVLWIDEIEKGIASNDHDGGTSQRVLGSLLTWMAEKRESVFIVATANNIDHLPPELVRKGRFDEIFFVDLPSGEVRCDIFNIHLKKRGLETERFDSEMLANQSEGFSGAEIEQAIVSALYASHTKGGELGTGDILEELIRTRPLSLVMQGRIDALRAWASERTVPSD